MNRLMFLFVVYLFVSASTAVFAQTSVRKGIDWAVGLDWVQVKEKAKIEQKNIFVDLYATWCAPCKAMDRNVYPLEEVGRYFNSRFISVRVQMDVLDNDSEQLQHIRKELKTLYSSPNVYPTFLFLSADGKVMHRAAGGFDATAFIQVAKEAMDPQNNFVAKIEKFERGEYESLDLKDLAINAKYADLDSLAKKIGDVYLKDMSMNDMLSQATWGFIAEIGEKDDEWRKTTTKPFLSRLSSEELAKPDVIHFIFSIAKNKELGNKVLDNYVNSLTKQELFTKENLALLEKVVSKSSERTFSILYDNAKAIDKVVGKKNFARDALDRIIASEEFYSPVYYPAVESVRNSTDPATLKDPEWNKIRSTVARKYDRATAMRIESGYKVNWYRLTGNKGKYIENLVIEMDKTKGWNLLGFFLNNNAMEVFRFSRNQRQLSRAIYWMNELFKNDPKEKDHSACDTYANLLYKAGRVKEAIQWQEKAVSLLPGDEELKNLEKMRKREPTWPAGYDIIK